MREKSGINCHSTATTTFDRICSKDAVGDDRRGVVHVGAAAEAPGVLLEDAASGSRRTVDLKSRGAPIVSGSIAAVSRKETVADFAAKGRDRTVVVAVTRDDVAVRDYATRHINRPADV